MSENNLEVLGNVCTSCIVAALLALAVVSGGTLLWVMYQAAG